MENPRLVRVCSASSPRESGFSLVEMLVAVAVFMSIMTIALSVLITTIDANRKAQVIKTTIDSVTFAIEDISKEMRMGTNYACLQPGENYSGDCPNGSTAVKFYNNNEKTNIIYKFISENNSGTLKKECEGATCSSIVAEDLISSDSGVKINNMKFYVVGATCEGGGVLCTGGKTQPRVIITVSGTISVKGGSTDFDLQTSVSQRIIKNN